MKHLKRVRKITPRKLAMVKFFPFSQNSFKRLIGGVQAVNTAPKTESFVTVR